ncbi:MAG: protein kinase domain-containing protein [Promethearchaeota archaeon]
MGRVRDGVCYTVYNSPLLNFYDAKAYCKNHFHPNSTLVTSSDLETNQFLFDLRINATTSTWLGLHDFGVADWRWVENGDVVGPFLYWSFMEPSGDGDCAEMWDTDNGGWNDAVCGILRSFFCSYPLYTCDSILVNQLNTTEHDGFHNTMCSGHGFCVGEDTCNCAACYNGTDCSIFDVERCFPSPPPSNTTENETIAVVIPPSSEDDTGFVDNMILVGIFASTTVGFVICIFIVYALGCTAFCVVVKKYKKEHKYHDPLHVAEVDDAIEQMANFEINKELFNIKFTDLKVLKKIGGGAQGSIFKCSWNGNTVAYKAFQTAEICITNNHNFKLFENEASVLSSISHPNIVKFYGCTLRPPRVGIVTEFCEYGDIKQYLSSYTIRQDEESSSAPYRIRRKIINGIIKGMTYLHERHVLHRDLKAENVLISNDIEAKIIDFGLGRIVEDNATKTKRIGTSVYIAPEIALGQHYDRKCDVFSFGILLFVILSENFSPYGQNMSHNVELRVAMNPEFRPNLKEVMKFSCDEDDQKMIIEWMQKCWDHEPSKRPIFKELYKLFVKEKEEKKK